MAVLTFQRWRSFQWNGFVWVSVALQELPMWNKTEWVTHGKRPKVGRWGEAAHTWPHSRLMATLRARRHLLHSSLRFLGGAHLTPPSCRCSGQHQLCMYLGTASDQDDPKAATSGQQRSTWGQATRSNTHPRCPHIPGEKLKADQRRNSGRLTIWKWPCPTTGTGTVLPGWGFQGEWQHELACCSAKWDWSIHHRIKRVSVGIQGPCTQEYLLETLLKTPISESIMEQRNREERSALEGERKGARRKDREKRLSGFAPLVFSTLLLPAQPNIGKSSHLELRQGMLWKNVGIRVAHLCSVSPLIKFPVYSEPQRNTGTHSVLSQRFGVSCLTPSC